MQRDDLMDMLKRAYAMEDSVVNILVQMINFHLKREGDAVLGEEGCQEAKDLLQVLFDDTGKHRKMLQQAVGIVDLYGADEY